MSNCVVEWMGRKFTSREEFLNVYKNDPQVKKYGDLIFDAPNNVETQMQLEKISGDSKRLREEFQKAKKEYLDGEQIEKFNPPYIGVTEFLRGLTTKDEKLLTPEFREFEYWRRRVKKWKEGEFNEDEKELYGNNIVISDNMTEDELKKWFENPYETDNQIIQLIKKMQSKWEDQAKLGTSIHDVLAILFSTTAKGQLTLDLEESFLLNMRFKNNYNEQYLNRENLKDIIKYARGLRDSIVKEIDGPLSFFPEFTISSKLSYDVPGKGNTVLGKIDLLVIDKNGDAHVLDYKVSPKRTFNTAKERSFFYQLGLYSRMLQANDIRMTSKTPKVMIAPINIENFKQGEFVTKIAERGDFLVDITAGSTLHEVAANLEEFIPEKIVVNLSSEDAIQKVSEFNSKAFPNISTTKSWDDESIHKLITSYDGVQYDGKTNKHYIKIGEKTFEGKDEGAVFEAVKKFYTETLPKHRKDLVQHILIALRKGIKHNTSNIQLPKTKLIDSEHGASAEWLKHRLSKYCHDYYTIEDNDTLLHYGVICIRNTKNQQLDFIKITTDNLEYQHNFNGRDKLLTGAFISDVAQSKKPGQLALKATNGNIHLMETMALLNCMPNLTKSGTIIGEILVADPIHLKGSAASNEELKYNFNELTSHIEGYQNNISELKFANKLDLARNRFKQIISLGEDTNWEKYSDYKSQASLLTDLDAAIIEDDEKKVLSKLEELRGFLEKSYDNLLSDSYNEDDNIARSLYEKVILAMAELKGITFRQQFKDNAKWIEKEHARNGGIQSLLLDNPGNLDNETLNVLTKLVTEAYQNVREDMQREMQTLRKMVSDLKESKDFNKFKEMTGGNAANLFKNMIEYKDGDILFKNPWDYNSSIPTEAERTFLKHVLTRINANRFANSSDEDILAMRDNNVVKYYRVPLAAGDLSSQASVLGGLMGAYKKKLSRLTPKKMAEDARKRLNGIFEEQQITNDDRMLYEMNNMFEVGERSTEQRLNKIRDLGEDYFETNLETLLLKHVMAYSNQKHINAIMPMAKAAHIHLITQGNLVNKDLKNATGYIKDYIKNKIKNEPLVDENWQAAHAAIGKIRSAASLLILGFSPIQYPGQLLQGLWTDILLGLQGMGNPDTAFTFDNFKSAFKEVYQDMFKLGHKPTKCSLLNEFFGMNDMDMNTYADKIKSDRYGIFNFTNLAFHTVGRPDFYNRMTIFVTQMKKDGTWDAYKEENGVLVYNWKDDKRFDVYAKGDKSNPKYNEQKGLYIAMAEQLEREHALNADGSRFKVGQPLPKAYTNQQIESYKSISDNLYGYYTHEKKSMIHALGMGALWMQMRTFWSGKKNQYLSSPGIKLQGKFVHQKDNEGNLMYYKEENGRLIPTKENTGVPIVKWEGQWQEGVMASLIQLWIDGKQKGFTDVFLSELWTNPEYELARANVIHLMHNLTLWTISGTFIAGFMADWEDEFEKKAKKSHDINDALAAAMAKVALKTVSYSFLDFNFIDSIGSPLINWQPVSFSFWQKRMQDAWDVAIGDMDFSKALIRSSGTLGTTSIFWETLLHDEHE